MYLSHYIDVREPLAPSNGIDLNSNMTNIWAKYITQYDRDTYDLYLSKGSSKEKFKFFTDSMVFVASNKSTFINGVSIARNLNNIIPLQIGKFVVEAGVAKDDITNLYEQFEDAYKSGVSVESTIELISKQLKPKPGINPNTVAKQFIALVLAPNPLTLYGMAMTFYTELGYNIIDKANFLAMRMYYNFRVIDRMYYRDSIG